MRVVLFGATGTIGSAVREQARAVGHELVLVSRSVDALGALHEHERAMAGDIADAGAVERGISAGVDAVISAVGPSSNTYGQVLVFESFATSLVEAMERHGVRRLIAVSGAGCTLPGERKPLGGRIASAFVRLAVRHVVAAKQRELEIIVASGLEWTLPRPARVVEGPLTGRYRVGANARGLRVTSHDLADFMVRCLGDGTYVRQAPVISS